MNLSQPNTNILSLIYQILSGFSEQDMQKIGITPEQRQPIMGKIIELFDNELANNCLYNNPSQPCYLNEWKNWITENPDQLTKILIDFIQYGGTDISPFTESIYNFQGTSKAEWGGIATAPTMADSNLSIPRSFIPAVSLPAPTAFGQAPAPTAFGQAPAPTAFGQAPDPTAFGQAPDPTAFGQVSVPELTPNIQDFMDFSKAPPKKGLNYVNNYLSPKNAFNVKPTLQTAKLPSLLGNVRANVSGNVRGNVRGNVQTKKKDALNIQTIYSGINRLSSRIKSPLSYVDTDSDNILSGLDKPLLSPNNAKKTEIAQQSLEKYRYYHLQKGKLDRLHGDIISKVQYLYDNDILALISKQINKINNQYNQGLFRTAITNTIGDNISSRLIYSAIQSIMENPQEDFFYFHLPNGTKFNLFEFKEKLLLKYICPQTGTRGINILEEIKKQLKQLYIKKKNISNTEFTVLHKNFLRRVASSTKYFAPFLFTLSFSRAVMYYDINSKKVDIKKFRIKVAEQTQYDIYYIYYFVKTCWKIYICGSENRKLSKGDCKEIYKEGKRRIMKGSGKKVTKKKVLKKKFKKKKSYRKKK